MTTSEVQNFEKANAILRAWTKRHNEAALSIASPLIASFILARFFPSAFGTVAMAVGAAMGLTLGVSLIPEVFRSRRGSLKPAVCLVTAMWIGAIVTAVLSVIE